MGEPRGRRGVRELRRESLPRLRQGDPLLVHLQRAHRGARPTLSERRLVPAPAQLQPCEGRAVQHLDRAQPRRGGLPSREGRRLHARRLAYRPHQLLHPALYPREPERGRPRGRPHDRRHKQPLVARPRDRGQAPRRYPGRLRGARRRAARPPGRRADPGPGQSRLARLQLLPPRARPGALARRGRGRLPGLRGAVCLAGGKDERVPRLGDLPQGHLRLRHEAQERLPWPGVLRVRERHGCRARMGAPRSRHRRDSRRLPHRVRPRAPRLDRAPSRAWSSESRRSSS